MSKTRDKKGEEVSQDEPRKPATEPYRNWFLLLGIISGIAVGLAAGALLINKDSEKSYLESKREVIVRQDILEESVASLEKEVQEIRKNNKERDQEITTLEDSLRKGLDTERAYLDEKRLRLWQEIDKINKTLERQELRIDEIAGASQSRD